MRFTGKFFLHQLYKNVLLKYLENKQYLKKKSLEKYAIFKGNVNLLLQISSLAVFQTFLYFLPIGSNAKQVLPYKFPMLNLVVWPKQKKSKKGKSTSTNGCLLYAQYFTALSPNVTSLLQPVNIQSNLGYKMLLKKRFI